MMKSKIVIGIVGSFFFLLLSSFWRSDDIFFLKRAFQFKANFFVNDHLGNYYLVGKHKIQKVVNGDSLVQFHQRTNWGDISSVDASNPMKIVVFYADYRRVEILDNWMTVLREVNLDDYVYMQANAICGSSTNGFWLYDENSALLKRIDDSGNLVRQSISTRQSIGKVLQVKYLQERNGKVYLSDPQVGIVVFDMFGTYIKTLPILGTNQFFVYLDKIYFFTDGKIMSYDTESLQFSTIGIDNQVIENAILVRNNYITTRADSVFVYGYKQ